MQQTGGASNIIVAAAVTLLMAVTCAAAGQCNMTQIARHGDPDRTRILASTTGEKAIFFTADLDVNTDGAARSYHPDDPRGQRLALNNIANAITKIFNAKGEPFNCEPRSGACFTRFIDVFEASRDAGYQREGHPHFETTGIIPWHRDANLGRDVPCTIKTGEFAGYFVSQTALIVNTGADVCDQNRYLDALSMNAIVLPRGTKWKSQGVVTDHGDLVAVVDAETGRIAFGIVGDSGPAKAIGEGTVALAASLGEVSISPTANFRDIKALKRSRVSTVIFPTRDVPHMTANHFSQADIDRLGAEALVSFGGPDRLRACAAHPSE